jgi:fructokinase
VEHIGGAPLNFAVHSGRLGGHAILVSAVGRDDAGRRALDEIAQLGLSTTYIRTVTEGETGRVSVSLLDGQPRYEIHRPAAYDFAQLSVADCEALSAQNPSWIYFGTLSQTSPLVRATTGRLLSACPGANRFYDLNLRQNCFTPELVQDLMAEADYVKLNEQEARVVMNMFGSEERSLEEFCRASAGAFGWKAVCVTRGECGCALLTGDEYYEAAGYPIDVADAVGAGDAFAAALVYGISRGWSAREVAEFSNRLGALVASRDGAVPPYDPAEILAINGTDDGLRADQDWQYS